MTTSNNASFMVKFGNATFKIPFSKDIKTKTILNLVKEQSTLPFQLPTMPFYLHRGTEYVIEPKDAETPVTDTKIQPDSTLDLDFLGPSLSNSIKSVHFSRPKNNAKRAHAPTVPLGSIADGPSTSNSTAPAIDHDELERMLEIPVLNLKPIPGNEMSIMLWAMELFESMKDMRKRQIITHRHTEILEVYMRTKDFEQFKATCKRIFERAVDLRKKMLDPTSAEGQAVMLRMIALKRIEQSRQHTMDHHPELLVPTNLLYINLIINGHPMQAMIDSGAQMCVMSEKCAKECNIFDLIDKAFKKVAFGIGGHSEILGRVHGCDVVIQGAHYAFTFDVMKKNQVNILIGLNMLKTLGCSIDLKKNCLVMGDGTATPFLNDNEVNELKEKWNADRDQHFEPDEIVLKRLMDMGFSREKCVGVLASTGNQFDLAVQWLSYEDDEKMDVDPK